MRRYALRDDQWERIKDFLARKSPINTGLRLQSSAPRQPGGNPKFTLSGRFSPNLWTSRI